ncbi:UNVERIFIED_CONTAM: hypothetical protein GTU68_063180, partial [Idotea baltica]|nr:hypothetical protein [Idotea baltica]
MARYYFKEGDNLLQRNEPSIFKPLQLMAISRQMLSPNTLIFAYGKETDFANIVDFCSNVTRVIIQGSYDTYKASNIIMNELRYNMSAFKSLQELSIYEACISKIDDLGPARRSVRRLIAKLSGVTGLSEVLACDSLHRELG